MAISKIVLKFLLERYVFNNIVNIFIFESRMDALIIIDSNVIEQVKKLGEQFKFHLSML